MKSSYEKLHELKSELLDNKIGILEVKGRYYLQDEITIELVDKINLSIQVEKTIKCKEYSDIDILLRTYHDLVISLNDKREKLRVACEYSTPAFIQLSKEVV